MRHTRLEALSVFGLALAMSFATAGRAAVGSESPPPVVYYNLTEVFRRLESLKEKPGEEIFRKYLLRGDVFTKDVIETWLEHKRERELNPVRQTPTPMEYQLYYDI